MLIAVEGRQSRLDPQQVTSLCEMQESGSSLTDVAKKFDIHKRTVSAQLKRQWIGCRPSTRKMNDTQDEAAILIRRAGWSLRQLGQHFSVDPSTISTEIIKFEKRRLLND